MLNVSTKVDCGDLIEDVYICDEKRCMVLFMLRNYCFCNLKKYHSPCSEIIKFGKIELTFSNLFLAIYFFGSFT